MKFSVLISVYNKENPYYLKDSLNSIINQTLLPDEIVLVKDGPLTNELENTLQFFLDNYVDLFKIISLPENVGLGKALAIGLEFVSYDLVARMDSDDVCYPNRFLEQVKYMIENEEISVLGGTIQEFNNEPGDLKSFRTLPEQHNEIAKMIKYRNPLNHPTVFFRKNHIIDVGSYKDMPLFEDYYLWVRMIQAGHKIHNLPQPLLHFRIGNNMIGRRSGMHYVIKEIRFLKILKKLGVLSSTELVLSYLTKTPFRLLPKSLILFIYRKLAR